MTYISCCSEFALNLEDYWCMNVITWIMTWYARMFDLKLTVCHSSLGFMGQWLCLILYLEDFRCTHTIALDNDSWWDVWTIIRLQWAIFHVPMILPYIPNTFAWIYLILWLMVKVNTVRDLILIVGHCDLYFIAQWLRLLYLNGFMDLHHTLVNGLGWYYKLSYLN